MGFLRIARFCLWGAAILFSAITVALAAHLLWWETYYFGVYSTFVAMAIAAGGLTLFTLPVFIGVDESRNGAVTSMILTEMVVVTILWILWLVAGGLTANNTAGINISACSAAAQAYSYTGYTGFGDIGAVCHEVPAIEAFSFLAAFALMGYAFVLLVFTLIAHNRGHGEIWMQSVKNANFFAPPANAPPSGVPVGFNEKAGGVLPQYQYPPNFVPPPQQFTPQGMPYGAVQQPMYPNYAGSPVPQQLTPLPGQPGYGQV